MELIKRVDNRLTIKLEHLERLYIKMAISFSVGPFSNGISEEEKQYAFSGSQGAEALKELLDPGWKERVAKYEEERKEAKAQGRRWSRSGKRRPKGPVLIELSYLDLLCIKKLLDIVIPNRIFGYEMDPSSVENVKGVRRDIERVLNEVRNRS